MIISSSWGVLVAHHQQTKLVSVALTSKDIEYFIPKIESLTIVRGRHSRELRPMLGDYILVSICSIWKTMMGIRGVRGMIMNCDSLPAQVLPDEMKRMHDMCDDAGVYHSEIVEAGGFLYGQSVTPRDGPFLNFVGKYDSQNKRGELIADFTLFGRDQKVTFKNGDLLAV
jgi:transcription antitermination factor NusG